VRALVIAFGLVFVAEGLMPLLLPSYWKDNMRRLLALRDGQLRFFGLMALAFGALVVLLGSYAVS
jgi:uncharacterized protein YjeT (DUF2065 family)